MSNISDYNFETIDNPYDQNLERGSVVGGEENTGISPVSSPADVSESAVSGKAMADMWIDNFIKSTNYQPKSHGFYLNAKEGYIECMKLYVGTGGIIGGKLDIPDLTTSNSFHIDALGNSWWGANVADGHTAANAYILNSGEAKFKNVTLESDVTINGIQPGSEIAIQGWQFDGEFSSSDYNTVAWASGTLTLLDGTTYSMAGNNTGNMAALTYIYLDIATSTTEFQTSATASDAVGSGKILVAVAEDNSDTTSQAVFQVFGGTGGKTILVDNIAANSASVNEFISNSAQIKNLTVTSAKINSLVADKITAGSGIIANLSVLSTLTMGSAATDGTIQSYGWDGSANGFQILGGVTPSFTLIGGTITGATLQTSATASSARVVITGNDSYYYDATTGGGGTITGDVASAFFPRTDSKSGTFVLQKRSSSIHDSGNVMEMFFNATAEYNADNYLFLGTYGLASTAALNYTDVVRAHGKSMIQIDSDASLTQGRPSEFAIYTNDAPELSASFNSDNCSRAYILAVEGDTPASYNWLTTGGGAFVALGIHKAAGSDVSLLIDTNGGWFANNFYPYATETLSLGSSSLKFNYIYTKYIGDSGSGSGVEYIYFSSPTRTRSLYAASTYDIVAQENFKVAGYLYLGSTDAYLQNDAGTLKWNGSAIGSGTVTSVATSGAITGGTITTTGTISHSASSGYKHIPSSGASQQFLKYSADGTAAWANLGASANAETIVPGFGTTNLGSTSYYWDNIYGGNIYVGGSSSIYLYLSSSRITSSADLVASGSLHATGNVYTGGVSSNSGSVNCAVVQGAYGSITFSSSGRIQVSNHFDPPDGGSYNTGGSVRYWGDVSYKTLTDRGCLGWFDDGVEMQDGTKVSDMEAIQSIKKHPTKNTVYGAPMLDYKTFPKVSYKKATDDNGKQLKRDKHTNEPYSEKINTDSGKIEKIPAQDGIEMTSMFSIMIGALKELDNRLKDMENKLTNK